MVGQLVFPGTQIVIPKCLRPQIIALAHERHLGLTGTKQNLRSRVWWPRMDKDVDRHCRSVMAVRLYPSQIHRSQLEPTLYRVHLGRTSLLISWDLYPQEKVS